MDVSFRLSSIRADVNASPTIEAATLHRVWLADQCRTDVTGPVDVKLKRPLSASPPTRMLMQ